MLLSHSASPECSLQSVDVSFCSAILFCSALVSQACSGPQSETCDKMEEKFTARLIRAIEKRPILYSQKHPEQKNEAKKFEAWREIRKELDEDVPVLKMKWKNLKDSYKKYKLSKRSDCSKAVLKLRNWAWANHMRFIDHPDETSPNEDPNVSITCLETRETGQESVGRDELDVTDTQKVQNYKRKRRLQRPKLQNKKRRVNNEKVDVKCDGVDLLFLGYADTFKKLTKRKQISVKFDMAKIFMEAEFSDLNNIEEAGTSEGYSAASEEFDDPLHANRGNIKEEMMQLSDVV